MTYGLRQSALTLFAVAVEAGLYRSYRGHDASFHWFTHFFVGAIAVLLGGAVWSWRRGRPMRVPLLWILLAHIVAMFPDLLFRLGIAHYRWMDVFLGHISTHFMPGRNLAWFAIASAALAFHLAVLDRLPPAPGALHTTALGDGPPVVLVHGLGASARYWEPLVAELASRYRTVAVDLLGFGRSPKPDGASYDIDCHADALGSVVPRRSIVVAHSTGAAIALHLAAARPDLVAGLVLLAPPAHSDRDSARNHISEIGTFAHLTVREPAVAAALCAVMCLLRPVAAAGAPVILRDVPARVAIDGALHTWPSYSRTMRRVVIDHRLDHDLQAVEIPVTILVGSDDRVATPGNIVDALARTGRDDIALRVIDGGDHHLALRHVDVVAGAVADLAERVAAAS